MDRFRPAARLRQHNASRFGVKRCTTRTAAKVRADGKPGRDIVYRGRNAIINHMSEAPILSLVTSGIRFRNGSSHFAT